MNVQDKPAKVQSTLKAQDKNPVEVQPNTPQKMGDSSQHAMSDEEDLVLSQALDELERSQTTEPMPKKRKFEFKPLNRLSLNTNRCKNSMKENVVQSVNTSTSSIQQPSPVPTTNGHNKPRILCTPNSDIENSQNESQKRKTFDKTLNTQESNAPIQQQNVVAIPKSDGTQPENDSAYDTMSNSYLSSTADPSPLCRKTGKTPLLFPSPSGAPPRQNNDDDDLSFLETLDF